MTSRVLQPYRALGIVTEARPFVLNQLGKEAFITVNIGKAFQVHLICLFYNDCFLTFSKGLQV